MDVITLTAREYVRQHPRIFVRHDPPVEIGDLIANMCLAVFGTRESQFSAETFGPWGLVRCPASFAPPFGPPHRCPFNEIVPFPPWEWHAPRPEILIGAYCDAILAFVNESEEYREGTVDSWPEIAPRPNEYVVVFRFREDLLVKEHARRG